MHIVTITDRKHRLSHQKTISNELRCILLIQNRFCISYIDHVNHKQIDNSGGHIMNNLIVNGRCYAVLYLPALSIFFQQKSFQLLASEWA